MRAGIVAWIVGLALLVSGCDPVLDRRYVNEGAGVDLYTADRASQIELLKTYESFICAQLGPGCGNDWGTFVLAGMNDIDQRCDGFLTWLDARRRDKEPILAEISAINTAIHSIMTVTGSSPKSLDIVTMAFGLASATYANWNSRLLISANQSTVQEIVYKGQGDFRAQIKTYRVPDQPTAIYLLRNYLRLCMPITIEASINTTTTLVLRDAPNAARNNLVVSTMGSGGPGSGANQGQPQQSTSQAGQKTERKNFVKTFPTFDTFIKDYDPKEFPKSVVIALLNNLCVPTGDVLKSMTQDAGPGIKSRINSFESTEMAVPADNLKITVDGRIDAAERDVLLKGTDCPAGMRNYYERRQFQDGAIAKIDNVIELLNREKIAGLNDLPLTTRLKDARDRIAKVRKSLVDRLGTKANVDASLGDQWSRDLFGALFILPKTPVPAATTPAAPTPAAPAPAPAGPTR